MIKENMDIRNYSKSKRVPLWMVAEKMKVSESVLCRRMRRELPAKQKEEIICIIDELSEGGV